MILESIFKLGWVKFGLSCDFCSMEGSNWLLMSETNLADVYVLGASANLSLAKISSIRRVRLPTNFFSVYNLALSR